jgi:hypothetical protein
MVDFNTKWRAVGNYKMARKMKTIFAGFLPDACLETALATCRFCFQAPKSVGGKKKNWGHWVRTRMQTGGNIPIGIGGYAVQRQSREWISFDAHQAVTEILEYLGLTLDDVYDMYGKPAEGCKYVVDLTTIVREFFAIPVTQVA